MSTYYFPAQPDFYVVTLELTYDGSRPCDVHREPIIAWCAQNGCATIPVTLNDSTYPDCAIQKPDGSVTEGSQTFRDLPDWACHHYPENIRENRLCIDPLCAFELMEALPGFSILEPCYDDEDGALKIHLSKIPILHWAFGADRVVRPVTHLGVLWKGGIILNPDGSVVECGNDSVEWSSIAAWEADLIKKEHTAREYYASRAAAKADQLTPH